MRDEAIGAFGRPCSSPSEGFVSLRFGNAPVTLGGEA